MGGGEEKKDMGSSIYTRPSEILDIQLNYYKREYISLLNN